VGFPKSARTAFCAALLFGALLLLSAPGAYAKSRESFRVDYDSLWSTAVRLLRVDYDAKIVDKDKETGYVVFLLKDVHGKESRGGFGSTGTHRS